MYLILPYIQHRACVHEEPVPTLWCTDCACGRFSSGQRNAGIVARKATVKATAGRRRPIRTNLDRAELNKEIVNNHTMLRASKELESERARPL
mgnify:CR=1 FL=1